MALFSRLLPSRVGVTQPVMNVPAFNLGGVTDASTGDHGDLAHIDLRVGFGV